MSTPTRSRRRIRAVAVQALLAPALVLGFVASSPAEATGRQPTKQATATGYGGAVASLDPYATQAGIDILKRGGNAVDAAIAASAMLGVTRPYDGSIGGGGFFVHYSTATGEVTTIDSREEAWAAMTPDVFLEDGAPIPFDERRVSGLSQGVPGLVRGWEMALEKYGTMTMQQVLQPARVVAQTGFIVDEEYQRRTDDNLAMLRDFTSSRDTFLVNGQAPRAGTTFRNRELANTYKLLAQHGADAFYEGRLAEAVVEVNNNPPVVDGASRNVRPGAMTLDDLAGYEAIERDPTRIEYRGYQVFGMGPRRAAVPPSARRSTSSRAMTSRASTRTRCSTSSSRAPRWRSRTATPTSATTRSSMYPSVACCPRASPTSEVP